MNNTYRTNSTDLHTERVYKQYREQLTFKTIRHFQPLAKLAVSLIGARVANLPPPA